MKTRTASDSTQRASGFRAAGMAVVLALTAIAVALLLLYEAFEFTRWVNDFLLAASEVFHKSVQLATLITVPLFAFLVVGIAWHYYAWFRNCWCKIRRHVKKALPILRHVTGAIILVAMFITMLNSLPYGGGIREAKNQQTFRRQPVEQPKPPEQPQSFSPQTERPEPPDATPTLPTLKLLLPVPRPRMAGRDVCDLFDDPTDAEWNACQLNLRRHPRHRGTGGPLCIMIHGRIKCLIWPPPIPKRRPPLPLDILPH